MTAIVAHSPVDDIGDPFRRVDKVHIVKVGVAGGCAVSAMSEQLADQGQVLARHDGLAGCRMAQVVQAQPAEPGIGADRPPAGREAPFAAASGVAREQKRIGLARARAGPARLSRNRATLFLGFFAMPRQGLVFRSRNPHSSARNIIARNFSKARLAAPGLSLLAVSNYAATSSGPMRSSGILPNAGRMRALR